MRLRLLARRRGTLTQAFRDLLTFGEASAGTTLRAEIPLPESDLSA
jgi:hypothetical protein